MPPLKSQVLFFLFALFLGAGFLFVRRTFPLHWLYLKRLFWHANKDSG